MQASTSGSEERINGRKYLWLGKAKLSVSDMVSDDFKKAWLALKDVHDKELHRLQMKLASMRKARLTEKRRHGSVAKNTQTWNASDSKSCEHCLLNETYRNMLQREFSNMQQKCLVQIAELTVENNKLKEENRKLSEKVKVNLPRIPLDFSESDDDDFISDIQKKRKQVYIVKEPSQSVQLPPRHDMEPHIEPKNSLCNLNVELNPGDASTALDSKEIFEVPESSFVDSPHVEEEFAEEANVLPSYTAYSLTDTLETSKKNDLITASNLSEVKEKTSTQKWGKNAFIWNVSSVSSEEVIIVSETSEENMPCNRNRSNVLPPLAKEKESNSSQVCLVGNTSKYIKKSKLSLSGFSYKSDISRKSDTDPLPSKEKTTLETTSGSENVRTCEERPESKSEIVLSGSVLKRKFKK